VFAYGVTAALIYVVLFFAVYSIQQHSIAYFDNYYTKLAHYMEKGDFDSAEKITFAAIERSKDSPEDMQNLYLVLSSIYEDAQKYDKAAGACQRSLEYIDSGTELYYAVSGMKDLFENNIEKAASSFEACLANYPDNFASNSYLGSIFFGNFGDEYIDYERALKYHNKAYTLNSYDVDNAFRLGVNYFLLEQYDRALEIFKESNSKAPKDGWVCYYLGLTYNMLGKKDEGNRYIEKALQLNPGRADVMKQK
jgi:tetratricopeptide (TPR) repeat protein